VQIKGEIAGSEDLFVDGKVEGTIQLEGNNLTIGPNGHVHANVSATTVIVQGNLQGNVRATDRAELKKSALVTGDIVAGRIAIEDGAFFKGSLEIRREDAKSASVAGSAKSQTAAAAPAASSAAASSSREPTKTA
jgi:cytoskeletal protein CcmA (bactofilin family)